MIFITWQKCHMCFIPLWFWWHKAGKKDLHRSEKMCKWYILSYWNLCQDKNKLLSVQITALINIFRKRNFYKWKKSEYRFAINVFLKALRKLDFIINKYVVKPTSLNRHLWYQSVQFQEHLYAQSLYLSCCCPGNYKSWFRISQHDAYEHLLQILYQILFGRIWETLVSASDPFLI